MGSDTAHAPSFNTDLPVPVSFQSFDISNGFVEYSTFPVSLGHDGLILPRTSFAIRNRTLTRMQARTQ
jgi:hypothetical protein